MVFDRTGYFGKLALDRFKLTSRCELRFCERDLA
jgi:hypothetical protein